MVGWLVGRSVGRSVAWLLGFSFSESALEFSPLPFGVPSALGPGVPQSQPVIHSLQRARRLEAAAAVASPSPPSPPPRPSYPHPARKANSSVSNQPYSGESRFSQLTRVETVWSAGGQGRPWRKDEGERPGMDESIFTPPLSTVLPITTLPQHVVSRGKKY